MIVSASAASANGATVTTPARNISGANGIVLFINTYPFDVSLISDNAGNSWAGTFHLGLDTGATVQSECFLFNPITSTSYQITVTNTAGTKPAVAYMAFNTTVGYDADNSLASATPVTSIQAGSVLPPHDNSLVIAAMGPAGIISGVSIDSGFTIVENVTATANSWGEVMAYQIQTTATSVNPLWSWTTAMRSSPIIVSIRGGIFTPGGGGGGAATPFTFLHAPLTLRPVAIGYGIKTIFDLKKNPMRSRRRFLIGEHNENS
jgi:hypothetical protein